MSGTYDASRMANFGRDLSSAYTKFVRAEEKLCEEINAAIASGVKPLKIAHDVMGRCPSHEARLSLLSTLMAMTQLEKIPKEVMDPFEEGIRARRI